MTAWLMICAVKTNQRYQEQVEVGKKSQSHLEIMKEMGIQCPEVVCCQMLHETGNLTSKIYRENNNGFGMKYNQRGHADYVLNGHAHYPTIYESIEDYRDWQKMRFKDRVFKSNDEYLYAIQHLPGGMAYAEDPKYIEKIKLKLKTFYGL